MRRKVRRALDAAIAALLLIVLCGGAYLAWEAHRDAEIASANRRYRALRHTAAPEASPSPAPPTPVPTPDGDTLRIALPTLPPARAEFDELLALNPDFCGWLRAGDDIDLPVVYRSGDNETYLDTGLDGQPSDGGCAFMDGFNRLYPPDQLTVLYGHNMRSGDMFGTLRRFSSREYMQLNPIVEFDTLFEDGEYVPVAAFFATASEVDIRQFQPDVEQFNALADRLAELSLYDTGVDVRFGDRLLALVTCAGSDEAQRFFLVCRKLRDDESALGMALTLGAN